MKRPKFRLLMGLVFFLMIQSVEADELSLDQAVSIALEGNPSLAQIKARAEAMAAIPSQEGSLPDPVLSFDALNMPVSEGLNLRKEDMTMLEVGMSQTLPFPGKLALKEQSATLEAEAWSNSVEEARLRLIKDVKSRWWQLYSMQQILNIMTHSEALLVQLKDISENLYKLGEGAQTEVLSAQLERSKLIQQRLKLYGMHHAETARLNALLNRPSTAPIVLPKEVNTRLPDLKQDGEFWTIAERDRPLLSQRKKMADAAQSKVDLAKKDYYPDFTLGAGYAFRQNTPMGESRSDFASLRLSMNLPLYADSKQAKAVDQRNSELLKERYAVNEAERKIQTEISASLAAYLSDKEQFILFEESILPLEKQNVNELMNQYRQGKADFSSLIKAQNAWLSDQMQYWQTFAEAQQALAKLNAAVGGKLP